MPILLLSVLLGAYVLQPQSKHHGSLVSKALSPDCALLATIGNGDRSLFIWDTRSQGILYRRSLRVDTSNYKPGVAFHPTKPWLAVFDTDEKNETFIAIIELGTWREIKRITSDYGIRISPHIRWFDGGTKIFASQQFFDVATGKLIGKPTLPTTNFEMYEGVDDTLVMKPYGEPEVLSFPFTGGAPTTAFTVGKYDRIGAVERKANRSLAPSSDPRLLALLNKIKTLQADRTKVDEMWSAEAELFALRCPDRLAPQVQEMVFGYAPWPEFLVSRSGDREEIMFSDDGNRLFVISTDLEAWDLRTLSLLWVQPLDRGMINAHQSPFWSGGHIAMPYADFIRVYDSHTGRLLRTENYPKKVNETEIRPNIALDRVAVVGTTGTGRNVPNQGMRQEQWVEMRPMKGKSAQWKVALDPFGRWCSSLFVNDEKWLLVVAEKQLLVLDAKTGKQLDSSKGISQECPELKWSRGTVLIQRGGYEPLTKLALPIRTVAERPSGWNNSAPGYWAAACDANERCALDDGPNILVQDKKNAVIQTLQGHSGQVDGLAFSADGKWLASRARDGTTRLWNSQWKSVFFLRQQGEWLAMNDEGYFDASLYGTRLVGFAQGLSLYGPEQFLLQKNRPDLLLSSVGLGSEDLIRHFAAQVSKRAQRAGIAAGSDAIDDPPTITSLIVNAKGDRIHVSIKAESKSSTLTTVQLFVNNVPLLQNGEVLGGSRAEWSHETVLTPGKNVVEVSVRDARGIESLRERQVLQSQSSSQGKTYFVGFGVSKYKDTALTLEYAAKDAADLSAAIGGKTLLFKDEQVNEAAIDKAKAFVGEAKEDDTVIVFIAGHGVHERTAQATYFYLPPNVQVNDLRGTAIEFERIEQLFYATKARQKLFFMDTCESGADSEEAMLAAVPKHLGSRGARGLQLKKCEGEDCPKPSTPRPFVDARGRLIYFDTSRRSGTWVFSSSRGAELSYESRALKNGLFTRGVLDALQGKADSDKDKRITLPELKSFVFEAVRQASTDLQHPTVDRDNLLLNVAFPAK